MLFDKQTSSPLNGKIIAILATDGFEESELLETKKALENAGAATEIVSIKSGEIKAWDQDHWSLSVPVDHTVEDLLDSDEASPAEAFDALVLPGGVINPDSLRTHQDAVAFTKAFIDLRKPVAAICHGPQILIETGCLKGHKLTSWPSLKTDLENAGATWVDEEVVYNQGLITSRKPEDIPKFAEKIIEVLSEDKDDDTGDLAKAPIQQEIPGVVLGFEPLSI